MKYYRLRQPYVLFFSLSVSFLTPHDALGEELNVYSFRQTALIQPIIDKFQQQTGNIVNIVSGKADALMQRFIADGPESHADIILTSDVARLEKLRTLKLLKKIDSEVLRQVIPYNLQDPHQEWFALSVRARTLFYAKDRVDPNVFSSIVDIASANWKGRLCARKGSHIYNLSLVAGLIGQFGVDATKPWVDGVSANLATRPQGGDRDQLRKIANEVCDIAIANTYYYGMLADSESAADREVYKKVGLHWLDQQGRGTHINISGAAVNVGSSKTKLAQEFIEFLLTEDIQKYYAQVNHEFPVRKGLSATGIVASWGKVKFDTDSLGNLYKHNQAAIELIENTSW